MLLVPTKENSMQVPAGMTESSVLSAIENAVSILVPNFKIPGFGSDDLAQEARLMAMECLPRYEPRPDADGRPTRPLENFVYSHIRRRLINFRRDHYRRADPPCKKCHLGVEHERDKKCDSYDQWYMRNE